jgi:hypothetical protein
MVPLHRVQVAPLGLVAQAQQPEPHTDRTVRTSEPLVDGVLDRLAHEVVDAGADCELVCVPAVAAAVHGSAAWNPGDVLACEGPGALAELSGLSALVAIPEPLLVDSQESGDSGQLIPVGRALAVDPLRHRRRG